MLALAAHSSCDRHQVTRVTRNDAVRIAATAVRRLQRSCAMSHRTNGRAGGDHKRLVTGKRRDALGLVLDAVDAVIEDGIPHPGWGRPDAELRTCALESAFAEAEEIVSRLRGTGVVPAPMSRADADRLIAAAAMICVWGRIQGQSHPVLDHLAEALESVPPSSAPLAQLALLA
jgi:hypothetical protein